MTHCVVLLVQAATRAYAARNAIDPLSLIGGEAATSAGAAASTGFHSLENQLGALVVSRCAKPDVSMTMHTA